MESGTNGTDGESQRVRPYNGAPELVSSSSSRREMIDSSSSFHQANNIETRKESFRSLGNSGSWRYGSISFSRGVSTQALEDIESEIVARAGDDGCSRSSSLRFEVNELHSIENGVGTIPIDLIIQSNICDTSMLNVMSATSPMTSEIISPLSSDAFIYSRDNECSDLQKQNTPGPGKVNQKQAPWLLEYISCLFHLAVFGILGVLLRYILQKLFGPNVSGLTADGTAFYLDLPSNIVGSFLMGWLGVVFKANISRVSDLVAIGLTTGFLGSLTTFSGWNQKMLELSADGRWVVSIVGYIIDTGIVYFFIGFGVWTARGFRWLLSRLGVRNLVRWKVDSCKRHLVALLVLVLMLALLWAMSGALLKTRLEADKSSAQLWLACIVGPLGVWARWFLARLNGRGLGRKGSMKWVPFGTLLANVIAACLMAALATTKKAVNTKRCEIIVNGIQLGFLGCLSTVSTFVAEVYAMAHSKCPWRAAVYVALTVVPSFALGTLVYSVPVWTKGY
ncbi:fluoride export protein 1-like [Magnolia sinica]|uniref:fluoride export protein 1-like n=1 Tax=Magnolia sinica TaxID=86752 RepID=UPI00265A27E5|nr:fluoride export protein 1-like [Magnolia sinica]XP_058088101.1 fluoride export protein 1-like [Magnolia sinica]XP_058088102.1 fluoride export protein 1-like [Magnolia sinica]